MEDTIVLYASAEHLNSMLLLSQFICKHHPSIAVVIISTAPDSAAESITGVPSITYRRLKPAALPSDLPKNPVELFFEIPRLHNPNLLESLQEISNKSKIRAFVIDFFCNSAFEVSMSLKLPTYFYVSSGAFGLCAFLHFPTIDENVAKDIGELNDYVEIPGCPPLLSSDFPKGMYFRNTNTYKHFLDTAKNMRKANGIVVNAFDALEHRAKEALVNGMCVPDSPTPPVFLMGPLVGTGKGKNGVVRHECLKWLDSQRDRSVVFLCFGRRGLFSGEQLKEMAIGLENSGQRFVWSVRSPPGKVGNDEDPDLDALLPEGFLESTKGRGFVIKSWAPQKEVLSHDAVGGFVTHCGRSSILEAVSFGVPMIGWPMYAEQRMNRVFMVEEMQVALNLNEVEDREGFVTAVELEKRVRELMEGKEGRAVRHKVREMKVAAEVAVRKGGSSVLALERFINKVVV